MCEGLRGLGRFVGTYLKGLGETVLRYGKIEETYRGCKLSFGVGNYCWCNRLKQGKKKNRVHELPGDLAVHVFYWIIYVNSGGTERKMLNNLEKYNLDSPQTSWLRDREDNNMPKMRDDNFSY